jgi:colanic acid biosynthesis glycosyl transferase WcaI
MTEPFLISMNLVLINQYFPPDGAPTGLMLERVAEELVDQGHEVTILCAKGGYAETGKKVESGEGDGLADPKYRVVRVGATGFGRGTFVGKIVDYAFFYLGVARHLAFMKPKPDRIIALTTPPYLSILARFFSKIRGGNHAHWVMDLYPDVMLAHGMLKPGGIPVRFLDSLARWGFGGRRCRMVLTLGPDMEGRTARHLPRETPRAWVPLWGTAGPLRAPSEEAALDDSEKSSQESGRVVLMYSGNMGLGHRFGEFLQAAASAGDGFAWKFHGQGKRRVEIEKFLADSPESQVSLGDYVPREELAAHLAAADVHLASLDPVWDGTMVPSKLQGIFAIGRPVIFVGSETCAMGAWILESGGGWVVSPDDAGGMRRALAEASDFVVRDRKGRAARNFAEAHFDPSVNVARIAKLIVSQEGGEER